MTKAAGTGRQAVDAVCRLRTGRHRRDSDGCDDAGDGRAGGRAAHSGLNRPDARTVPIFAMTANAFADDAERSRQAGMNEHLTKPLDAQVLLKTIGKYRKQGKQPHL